MRKQLSAISILGLVLTFFTAGPAIPATTAGQIGVLTTGQSTLVAQSEIISTQAVDITLNVTTEAGAAINAASFLIFSRGTGTPNSTLDKEEDFIGYEEVTNGTLTLPQVEDGNYSVEVTPAISQNPNVSKTVFSIEVASSVVTVKREDDVTMTGSGNSFDLKLFDANVIGRIIDPTTSQPVVSNFDNEIYYEVEVLRYSGGNFFGYGSYHMADANGNYAIRILENGAYKLRFKPFGRTDVASATTDEFTITGTTLVTIPDQELSDPTLVVSVRSATGTEEIPFVGINIIDENFQYDFAFTGPTGVTALSFEGPGTYTLEIDPPWGTAGYAKNKYTVIVTESGGVQSAVIDNESPLAPETPNRYVLRFKDPTIQGRVLDPTGTTGIAFAQVLPLRDGDPYPLWEYAGFADGDGNYSIALPEGSYKVYAQAPYGNSLFGDGPQQGPIVVDADSVATSVPTGFTASEFDLRLGEPTWSGTVVSPLDNTQVLSDVQVCLYPSMFASMTSCSQTDESGRFALSAPADFTGFDEGSELWIDAWNLPEFTGKRFIGTGTDGVDSVLGAFTVGETYQDIVLEMGLPNWEVKVLQPGGQPASRVWVWANSDFGYIGSKETDENGIARFSVSDSDRGQVIRIGTDLWNNQELNQKFTAVESIVEPNTLTLNSTTQRYETTVTLATPNFVGLVKKPSDAGPVVTGNTGIQVQNLDTGEYRWINVARNGVVTGDLVAPSSGSFTYQLKVSPPWDSIDNISATDYFVTVESDRSITAVTDKAGDAASSDTIRIDNVDTPAYVLMLSPSNVSGKVVQDLDGNEVNVRDSWIETRYQGTNEYLWDKWANSKFDGSFGVNLDPGNYELIANAPWNSSKEKSAPCQVLVNSSSVVDVAGSSSSCVDSQGAVKLKLRDGNLQINLTEPGESTTAVAFASVGIAIGNWYNWTQSNRDGEAFLLLDLDEIRAANSNKTTGTLDIRFWVDPPWGTSGLSRWECVTGDAEPICDSLPDFDFASGLAVDTTTQVKVVDASFPAPNSVITVTDGSGNAVGVGAWVSIYKVVGGNQMWVDGGQTDYQGKAYFNLDISDTTSDYVVEVNPPWNKSNELSRNSHTVDSVTALATSLDAKFALRAANTFITVNRADGSGTARWSWIQVEKLNASTSSYEWADSASANQVGKASLALDAASTYKLTIFPGFASAGTRTTCFVTTDLEGDITLGTVDPAQTCATGSITGGDNLTIGLSNGNLTGVVSDGGDATKKLEGVVVVAKREVSTGVFETVEAVTDRAGKYGLQLDSDGTWAVSFFYSGVASNGDQFQATLNQSVTVTSGTAAASPLNINLVRATS